MITSAGPAYQGGNWRLGVRPAPRGRVLPCPGRAAGQHDPRGGPAPLTRGGCPTGMALMGGVPLRLRAELRQQWRAWLALAVLLGIVGGIALAAAAGARRTDAAYPRLLRQSHAADLLVSPARSGFHGYFRALGRLPEVSSADAAAFLQMSLAVHGASPYSGMVAEASPFGGEGTLVDRVRVLAGHMFDPADPRAVVISRTLADRAHVGPGGILHLIGYPQPGSNPDTARGAAGLPGVGGRGLRR